MTELRQRIVEQAARHLSGSAPHEAVEERLREALAAHSEAELERFVERIATTGNDYGYHPPDPVAKSLDHALARLVIRSDSSLEGTVHLEAARRGPVLLLANHLSYSDAHVVEYLLGREGFDDVARRLTVLAGPKVYSDPVRRLSSLCFGSIKVPQSSERASEEAVMPRREVARLAAVVFQSAAERYAAGDHLLIFVEGTRSRTGAMQAALPAVSRYLDLPEAVVLPLGIVGAEALQPVGDDTAHATRLTVRVGAPLAAAALREASQGRRKSMMDAVGLAIARLLPADYRGVYGATDAPEVRAAADVLERAGGVPG